ncbi:MAG: LolA family protein [Flavobacteriales bacterium]
MTRTLLLLFLLPLGLMAQSDEKSKSILKAVSETHKAYKDISVEFDYTLENKDAGINDTRSGKLALNGDKFYLQLMGQDIYSDGKIVWYVMKEDLEVHIKSIAEFKEETELDPANFFNQYDNGYKSKFQAEELKDGKTLNVVDLFPEDPGKKPYSRIRMAINKSNNHVSYSKTFGKDGTNYLLEVKSMKTDAGLPVEDFVFNQAQFEADDYDVVDFR